MANVNGVVRQMPLGINDQNHRFFRSTPIAVPNGDTLTLNFPDQAGTGGEGPALQSWHPFVVSPGTYGGGAVGARTFTPAPATVTWTWNEDTGNLVLTNGSGGELTLAVAVDFQAIDT